MYRYYKMKISVKKNQNKRIDNKIYKMHFFYNTLYIISFILLFILYIPLSLIQNISVSFAQNINNHDFTKTISKVDKQMIRKLQYVINSNDTNLNENFSLQNQKNINFLIENLGIMIRMKCEDIPLITKKISQEMPWLIGSFQKKIEKKLLSCNDKFFLHDIKNINHIIKAESPESNLILLHGQISNDQSSIQSYSKHGAHNLKQENKQQKKSSLKQDKIAQLKQNWLISNIPYEREKELLDQYSLTENEVIARVSFLIWHNKLESAELFINKISTHQKKFWQNQIKIASSKKIITTSHNQISSDFEKYLYLKSISKNKNEAESSIFIANLVSYKPKSYRELWWKNIAQFAVREAIRLKQYKSAYIITQNYMPNSANNREHIIEKVEGHWLAGFIAFKFLNNSQDAYKHFVSMYEVAKLANSKSQAAYWAGIAAKTQKKNNESQKWLKIAKEYRGYFYAYIADIILYSEETITYDSLFTTIKTNKQSILDIQNKSGKQKEIEKHSAQINDMIFAVNLLFQAGYDTQAENIIDYMSQQNSEDLKITINNILQYFYQENQGHVSVKFSRKVANQHGCIHPLSYPKISINSTCNRKKSFYLSIMRQESSFDTKALSSAGAFGLMQLMPDTAKRMAKIVGLHENSYKTNPNANIAKGVCYIDWLSERFPSLILVAAGYNAGENNAKKWQTYYNFSDKNIHEVATFVELIPFGETRLYVKKVIENFWTYELILHKKKRKADLLNELRIS